MHHPKRPLLMLGLSPIWTPIVESRQAYLTAIYAAARTGVPIADLLVDLEAVGSAGTQLVELGRECRT